MQNRTFIATLVFVALICASCSTSSAPAISNLPSSSLSDSSNIEISSEDATSSSSVSEDSAIESILDPNYDGPKYDLLYENEYIPGDINGKIFEIYAEIDLADDDWHDQVKSVVSHLNKEHEEYPDIIYKIFNSRDNREYNQATYSNLIALWHSRSWSALFDSEPVPTITWYPEGGGVNSVSESEEWEP